MMRQAHIFYEGIVQGVGFRFTVQRVACQLGLGGWVRNLVDGRVEVVVEGGEEVIQEFIARIGQRFEGKIKDVQTEYLPATGKFREFDIRF